MLRIDHDGPEVRATLRDWIASRAQDADATPALDGVRLFEQRVLTSLHLPELILLIERLRREPVDVTTLTAADVASIDAIVARWFAPGADR
jgi:hypothetical protein